MKEKALPEGWVETILRDSLEIVLGKSPESQFVNNEGKGLPFYQGKAEFGDLYPTPRNYCEKPKKIAKPNDILLSVRAPVGPTNLATENVAIGRGLAAIRAINDDYKYVLYYFRYLEPWLKMQGQGSTFEAITGKFVKDLTFIRPPLETQQKLAKKFTALLSQVAEIKQRLEKIPALLKTYRQSVLARAVNGELSAKWREENGVSLESWECGYIKDFVEKPIYGTSAKSQKEGKIPVLRMGNIQAGQIDWENLVYTSNDAEIQKYSLNKYDVLFNRTNSPELVGKTAIYLGEREAIFAGYLIRVRCKNMLNPKFLNYHLNSPFAKNYCLEVKSDGVSQSNINAQKLLAYPLNLPSLEEQNYITQAVEKHLNFANQLEAQVNAALERVNLMTQAILAKGFLLNKNRGANNGNQLLFSSSLSNLIQTGSICRALFF